MEIIYRICLPRERASVPVVRHLTSATLTALDVTEQCVSDIEVALAEACTNVLQHAAGLDEEYEIDIEIGDDDCLIRVKDTGEGLDEELLKQAAQETDTGGRGIALMRALVDHLDFVSRPEAGTVVQISKALSMKRDAPLAQLRSDGTV
jgi:serine/threonine-protein kinase RsbW